jgi:cell division protein FtsQ
MPGAEVRLPSLPVIRFGWRIVSGLLSGILAFTLYTMWNSPVYQVQTVGVEGLQRLTVGDINAVANVSGKPIFAVDPDKIRSELQAAFLELSEIFVEVGIPANVKIRVIERQPVLAWQQGDQMLWIDAAGVAFPRRGGNGPPIVINAEESPPSPSATAGIDQAEFTSPSRFLPPQLVTAILALSVQAPENAQLLYTRAHGLGWKDKRGWEVYLGSDLDDIEMKLFVYEAIVKRLSKEEIQPALISVEYVHAPYYRLEQ